MPFSIPLGLTLILTMPLCHFQLGVVALTQGEVLLVQRSMIGSVLCYSLLVSALRS